MRILARALGQASVNPSVYGDCQYQLPGVTPQPGIPICSASYEASQEAELAAQEAAEVPGEVAPANKIAQYNANYATTVGQGIPIVATPASSAPASAVTPPASGSSSTNPPASSVTPAASASLPPIVAPAATAASGCLQLFGASEPCWGPIGEYTVLAGLAALVGLWLMFRK